MRTLKIQKGDRVRWITANGIVRLGKVIAATSETCRVHFPGGPWGDEMTLGFDEYSRRWPERLKR